MKSDGGAAFPVLRTGPKYTDRGTPYGEQIYSVGGMTLRDYFAGQALIGIIGKYPCEICEIKPGGYAPVNVSAAKGAYAYADALLAEREQEGGSHE